MLRRGKAKRIKIYASESSRWQGRPLATAVLELLIAKDMAGGTVTRALAGYTRSKGIVAATLVDLAADLPVQIEIVDTAEAVDAVLPDLYLMVDKGLITVDEVEVIKYTGEPPAQAADAARRPEKVLMQGKQLAIHISANDVYNGEPLHDAILKRFNLEGFAGATVFKALEGFGASHAIHRDRPFSLHREAPILVLMIDTADNVDKAKAVLDGMLSHGAIVVSDVEITYFGHSAEGRGAAG